MEELQRQKQALERQVKELQEELLIQKRKSKLKQYRDDFALMPQREKVKRSWKDEPDWDIKERLKLISGLDLFPLDFAKEENKLFILSYDMFATLGLVEKFNIPSEKLQNFVMALRDWYRDVPFHNFYHAFNVAQTLFFFLKTCQASEKFSPLEQLAMLISAFCHGTRKFDVLSDTKILTIPEFLTHLCAMLELRKHISTSLLFYLFLLTLISDFSVLEMHHCNETFKLLHNPDSNILANLDANQYKQVRKIVCSCILATDLGVHGDFMNNLKAKIENINYENFDDRKLVMCCLVKAADISNEIRPSHIGKKWATRVMAEFYSQAALEKALGMPAAPHMDPEKTNTPGGQIGFIGFLCIPFFQLMARVFSGIQVCVDNLLANKEEWTKIDSELKQKQQK